MRLRRRDDDRAGVTYKLCSLFLQYPDAELIAARDELAGVARELARSPGGPKLASFSEWWCAAEPMTLQQLYVETFDLEKRCGLYMSFVGEGDRRQRGTALLRLKRMYRAAAASATASIAPRRGSVCP